MGTEDKMKTTGRLITPEEAQKLSGDAATVRNKYGDYFDQCDKAGQPILVEGLKRGQIAALTRKAKDNGYESRALYKQNGVVIWPKKKEEAKASEAPKVVETPKAPDTTEKAPAAPATPRTKKGA